MVVSWYEDDGWVSSCDDAEMHHCGDDVILTTLMPHCCAQAVMYGDHQFVMLRLVHDTMPLCLHGVTHMGVTTTNSYIENRQRQMQQPQNIMCICGSTWGWHTWGLWWQTITIEKTMRQLHNMCQITHTCKERGCDDYIPHDIVRVAVTHKYLMFFYFI